MIERSNAAGRAPTASQPESPAQTSGELVAALTHRLSLLARNELELAVARHGPALRGLVIEVATVLAAGAMLLLALAALGWAGAQALALAMPSWAAGLIVAAILAAAAGLLALLDHPRRLVGRFAHETAAGRIEEAERRRRESEAAVTEMAERLGEALAREAAARELREGVSAAEHLAARAEQDAEDVVRQLLAAFLAPGKASVNLLERVVLGRPRPT